MNEPALTPVEALSALASHLRARKVQFYAHESKDGSAPALEISAGDYPTLMIYWAGRMFYIFPSDQNAEQFPTVETSSFFIVGWLLRHGVTL